MVCRDETLEIELVADGAQFRQPGQKPKPGDAWTEPPVPTLHVMTRESGLLMHQLGETISLTCSGHVMLHRRPGSEPRRSTHSARFEGNPPTRGICAASTPWQRKLAWLLRCVNAACAHFQPTYNISLNVIFFTLPSNVDYISQHLLVNNVFLLDPVPLYDPTRHADFPEYHNAHGGHQHALTMMYAAQQRALMMTRGFSMEQNQLDKARQVEVQREQVDQVFKSMEVGGDLDMSDPGELHCLGWTSDADR